MYNNQRILALIPARGGSKGIKDKNIVPLLGKPLISYSIEAGKASKYIDTIVVSTDSQKIAEVAVLYGADIPFLRPKELALDTSKTIDAVIHAIDLINSKKPVYDVLILLQPTQPLRTSFDIDRAIETYFENDENDLASVSLVTDHPLLIRSISENGNLIPLLQKNSTCRRQDMPPYYRINGCIYINKIKELNYNTSFNDNLVPYIMPQNHSIDIDCIDDLHIAEMYLREYK